MPPRARQRLLHTCQSGGRQCAPGLCPVRTAHRRHGPRVQGRSPGGFPTAFDTKSGARAESEAPGALPIKIQRSHLQKSGPSPGGIPAGGWRAGVVAPHGRPPCMAALRMRADDIRPYERLPKIPWFFRGMALTAARRAKPVQRSGYQGLQGNPDACRPGRGSAFYIRANRAGGNARPVSALSVQPTAAMDPGSRAAALVVFPPLLTPKAVPGPSRRRRGRFR